MKDDIGSIGHDQRFEVGESVSSHANLGQVVSDAELTVSPCL
jgi:hypothetical protein